MCAVYLIQKWAVNTTQLYLKLRNGSEQNRLKSANTEAAQNWPYLIILYIYMTSTNQNNVIKTNVINIVLLVYERPLNYIAYIIRTCVLKWADMGRRPTYTTMLYHFVKVSICPDSDTLSFML